MKLILKNEQIADEVSLNSVTLVSGEPFPLMKRQLLSVLQLFKYKCRR